MEVSPPNQQLGYHSCFLGEPLHQEGKGYQLLTWQQKWPEEQACGSSEVWPLKTQEDVSQLGTRKRGEVTRGSLSRCLTRTHSVEWPNSLSPGCYGRAHQQSGHGGQQLGNANGRSPRLTANTAPPEKFQPWGHQSASGGMPPHTCFCCGPAPAIAAVWGRSYGMEPFFSTLPPGRCGTWSLSNLFLLPVSLISTPACLAAS